MVEQGFGDGTATASGEYTYTEVSTDAYTDSQIEVVAAYNVELETPMYEMEKGGIVATVVEPPTDVSGPTVTAGNGN